MKTPPAKLTRAKLTRAKLTRAKLTRADQRILLWSESQAAAMLGAYTGGPEEHEYCENLRQLRDTLKKVKNLIRKP